MSASTVDRLLDERTRLVAKNAATSGHLWAAEHLLKQVDTLLRDAIMPTPALSACRDSMRDEIHELLAEDREHPGNDIALPGGGEATGQGGARG